MLTKARLAVGDRLGRPRRWRYFELLPKGSVGVEVGVFRTGLTPHLLRVAQPRELHLIDAWWTRVEDRYPDWGAYRPVRLHIGDTVEVLSGFPDRHFGWAYLDAHHDREQTAQELELLRAKVDGPVMGDDWNGVAAAVNDFCDRHGWALAPLDEAFGQWMIRP